MGIEASRMQSIVDRRVSRRAFLSGSGVLFSSALGSCGLLGPQGRPGNRRLTARPGQPFLQPDLGESMLGLGSGRDGLIFVPVSYTPAVPLPLLVMLHGATGSSQGMRGLGLAADELGAIVLIPESREYTWDLILGRYGPDVEFIDRALAYTFERYSVDPSKILLGGFSDGASYALSLGVSNGDLFTHLIAFSPGRLDYGDPIVGRPEVFVSHGLIDAVLPVQASRDTIVPDLRDKGYSVEYREFIGGHSVPGDIADAAMDWFLD